MADSTIAGLAVELTDPIGDDLIEVVDDVAGTPAGKKMKLSTLRGFLAHIDGLVLSFSSTTAIAVSAGRVGVNGKLYSYAGATYTSGSTMTDIAGAAVTLGASKCYFAFAYNNAGTLEVRFEERDGTGDGADPTFDTTLDYWKAATTGVEARRIGKFWTNASSQVIQFEAYAFGRERTYVANWATVIALNAGTSTTYAAITLTPYFTADDVVMLLGLRLGTTNATATATSMALSTDGGTTDVINSASYLILNVSQRFPSHAEIPYTGTLHYKVAGTSAASSLDFQGFKHYV